MAWRFGGACPYRTYHGLDGEWQDEFGERRPPLFPRRLKMFIYGCGAQAEKEHHAEVKAMAGGK